MPASSSCWLLRWREGGEKVSRVGDTVHKEKHKCDIHVNASGSVTCTFTCNYMYMYMYMHH